MFSFDEPVLDYNQKTLKLISAEISKHYNIEDIISILQSERVPEYLLEGATGKEEVLSKIFIYYYSEAGICVGLTGMIEAFVNPRNDVDIKSDLADNLKSILGDISLELDFDNDGNPSILPMTFDQEEEHNYNQKKILEENIKNHLEEISQIRDLHKIYTDVISVFFGNKCEPTQDLNKCYKYLSVLISRKIKEIGLDEELKFRTFFEGDLYTAEKEYLDYLLRLDSAPKKPFSWESARPILYFFQGKLVNLVGTYNSNSKDSKIEIVIEKIKKILAEITGSVVNVDKADSKLSSKALHGDIIYPELKWEKVTLKMKEGLHDIEIFYDGKLIKKTNYVQLGFYTGEKQQKQNPQWKMLCALSVLSGTDIRQATAEGLRYMINSNKPPTIPNVHQIKRNLVKSLCRIFKTQENPFHDNQDYYSPKFVILPETSFRQEEVWQQGGKLNENILDDEEVDIEQDDL